LKEYQYRYQSSYISEKSTMHWIEHFVKEGNIVWDVGANVGAYSLLLGKRLQRLGGGGSFSD
jgi:hypothetical protein